MYRSEQEKVCQTLENKTTSTERHRCCLEKNARDLRAGPEPYALRPAPVGLKRNAVTEGLFLFSVPDLPGWSFQGVTAVGCLSPPLFPSVHLPPSLQLRRDRRGQGVPQP